MSEQWLFYRLIVHPCQTSACQRPWLFYRLTPLYYYIACREFRLYFPLILLYNLPETLDLPLTIHYNKAWQSLSMHHYLTILSYCITSQRLWLHCHLTLLYSLAKLLAVQPSETSIYRVKHFGCTTFWHYYDAHVRPHLHCHLPINSPAESLAVQPSDTTMRHVRDPDCTAIWHIAWQSPWLYNRLTLLYTLSKIKAVQPSETTIYHVKDIGYTITWHFC